MVSCAYASVDWLIYVLGAVGIAVSSFYFVVWYGARTRILEAVARSQVRLVVERWQRSSRMAEYVSDPVSRGSLLLALSHSELFPSEVEGDIEALRSVQGSRYLVLRWSVFAIAGLVAIVVTLFDLDADWFFGMLVFGFILFCVYFMWYEWVSDQIRSEFKTRVFEEPDQE